VALLLYWALSAMSLRRQPVPSASYAGQQG